MSRIQRIKLDLRPLELNEINLETLRDQAVDEAEDDEKEEEEEVVKEEKNTQVKEEEKKEEEKKEEDEEKKEKKKKVKKEKKKEEEEEKKLSEPIVAYDRPISRMPKKKGKKVTKFVVPPPKVFFSRFHFKFHC